MALCIMVRVYVVSKTHSVSGCFSILEGTRPGCHGQLREMRNPNAAGDPRGHCSHFFIDRLCSASGLLHAAFGTAWRRGISLWAFVMIQEAVGCWRVVAECRWFWNALVFEFVLLTSAGIC